MKSLKLIIFLLVIIISFTARPQKAIANTAGSSATLAITNNNSTNKYKKTIILRDFLKTYNSPLAENASVFIDEADKNNLDWKLVASIAGVESYFGQMIPPNSYNGWGFGVYGSNVRYFASWNDGISTVSNALRSDYINNLGATNIYQIGSIYAEDPNWANKVTSFMKLLEQYESKSANNTLSFSI